MSVKTKLAVAGFTSGPNAHAHLLKHVLRLTEQSDPQRRADVDPEHWEKLIVAPSLTPRLAQRRQVALATLRKVDGCAAGQLAKASTQRICQTCQNREATRVVTGEMKTLLRAYVTVAEHALASRQQAPQLSVAYRGDLGPQLEVTDSRKVRVIVALDDTLSVARVVTCYRTTDNLKQQTLRYGRLRAAHSRCGRLLDGER